MSNTAQKMSNYRWVIAALLLFSTTINYMDRNVIGFLKDFFCSEEGFNWTPQQFSYLTSVFTAAYAIATLLVGWVIDKIGTKLGLALSLIVWSFSGIGSAFMGKGLVPHAIARCFFGIGEAGNFPASIKAVAEWFPKKERALATGIFNAGSNVGAMICALFVPWCLLHWSGAPAFGTFEGWQMAFIITGVIGFLWLIAWGICYKAPKVMLEKGTINQAEYDYINSDAEDAAPAADEPAVKVGWGKMLGYRQTWSFVFGKFMTDGIWWFLLFWLPTYVKQQFCGALSPEETTTYVTIVNFIVFGVAIVGSVFGGAIPMFFINRNWETYKARMTAMVLIAICPLILFAAQPLANVMGASTASLVVAITIISIAGAAHQAWSANLFTTVSDMFPKAAVGTVTGIGAAAGGLGGVLVQLLAGYCDGTFETATAYMIMFSVCAVSYLIAWIGMKLLVPKFKQVEL